MAHLVFADHGGAAHLMRHFVSWHLVEKVLFQALVTLRQVAHLDSLLLLSLSCLLETRCGNWPSGVP